MDQLIPPFPFSHPKGANPFVGIATFAGYPLWQPQMKADAVILGIPYDEGTTNRPGTRFGPRAIRNASMLYNYENEGGRFFDADRRKWILQGKVIADAGDVNIQPLCLSTNWGAVTQSVKDILITGAVPAVIGGDHSITYPVIRAFQGQHFHYVHFDSHLDCDRISGSDFTHGSPLARIMKDRLIQSATVIGVRGLTSCGHDLKWIEGQGAIIITAREFREKGLGALKDYFRKGPYYISVDIDFFDPCAAPGTGTVEPGGLMFPDFSDVIHLIIGKGDILGFDLVEVNPLLDGNDAITSYLAARCIIELMSAALD